MVIYTNHSKPLYCFLADYSSVENATASVHCLESAGKSDMKKLEEVCSRRNWQIVNVPADGHCMFSSLAIQVGRPLAAHAIRKERVAFLRTHANIVSSLSTLHFFVSHCATIIMLDMRLLRKVCVRDHLSVSQSVITLASTTLF